MAQAGFNRYAAGSKLYGSGRSFPTMGPVSAQGQNGYNERDLMARARRNAILQRMKAQQGGRFASADWLRGR